MVNVQHNKISHMQRNSKRWNRHQSEPSSRSRPDYLWLLRPGLRRCRSLSSAICRCPSTDCKGNKKLSWCWQQARRV